MQSAQERAYRRAQRLEFDRLRSSGMSSKQAAKEVGVSHTTAWRWDKARMLAENESMEFAGIQDYEATGDKIGPEELACARHVLANREEFSAATVERAERWLQSGSEA